MFLEHIVRFLLYLYTLTPIWAALYTLGPIHVAEMTDVRKDIVTPAKDILFKRK